MGSAIMMHGTFPILINEVPDLNDPRRPQRRGNHLIRQGNGAEETKDRLHLKPATTALYDRWWQQIGDY